MQSSAEIVPQQASVLTHIAPSEVPRLWPRVVDMVELALAHGDGNFHLYDILARLLAAQADLWIARSSKVSEGIDACCITQVVQYPRKKVLALFVVAGHDRQKWMHHERELARYARELGCDALEGYARDGWLRVRPDWRRVYTVIRRDVAEVLNGPSAV